jgi:hypothetical protein
MSPYRGCEVVVGGEGDGPVVGWWSSGVREHSWGGCGGYQWYSGRRNHGGSGGCWGVREVG